MSSTTEITLVLVLVAVACAVPGCFLVLRRMSLVSDAISHVLLFGIVLAYLAVRDVGSLWLPVAAAAAGVLTVSLVELLQRTKLVKADAAIGLVFPALFAVGVILASLFLRNTHLDVDAVLLGQAEFADEARWVVAGVPVKPLHAATVMLAVNLLLVAVFFKELKLTTFDPALASSLGFRPGLVHYALMTAVSLTAVVAFDAVGPVLVVGFFVIPAAAAFLLTDRLGVMLVIAALIGAVAATTGTQSAVAVNTNIAGTVATALGVLFAVAFVAAPGRGLFAQAARRWRQKREFLETILAIHLFQHEGTPAEADEARFDGLHAHLSWAPADVAAVVGRAERHGLLVRADKLLKLTETGRVRARSLLGEPGA